MSYALVNVTKELKKAAKGKPTKLPVAILLEMATRDYPAIQQKVQKLYGIVSE